MPFQTLADDDVRARFESTMLPHLDDVFRLAMWLMRDRAEAEDVVQETFSQAVQSFHRFQPGTNARAWLLAILRNVRANRQRAQRRSVIQPGDDDVMERLPAVDQTPQHLTEREVLDALRELPQAYQEVVLLSDVEDLSYRDIASTLHIPIGTVMSRLHRARRMLRATLAPYAATRGIGQSGADAPSADGSQGSVS